MGPNRHMAGLFCLICFATAALAFSEEVKRHSFLMPNVTPDRPELYLCTPLKIWPTSANYYIVGFEPNATMDTAHHMLLYGCTEPGTDDLVWNCGEMGKNSVMNMKTHSPCAEGSHVLYAWARDAPMLTLPPDVGFQVGQGTAIKYLVLQVHYASITKFADGSSDNSGIFLHYTDKPKEKLAGVVLLGTGGVISPHSQTNMETECRIRENKIIYPFAYRTHTHSLGKVVSGYSIRTDKFGMDQWSLLGKRDPLTPQMFYPVVNSDPIRFGDKLAARCTMVSNRNRNTYIGATNEDEMCNFYLMYYVRRGTPLDMKYCFTAGPPNFTWEKSNDLNNIPDADASAL